MESEVRGVKRAGGGAEEGAAPPKAVRGCACEGCARGNCGVCAYCEDMPRYIGMGLILEEFPTNRLLPRFGGENRLKQRCLERACLRPGLATAATSTSRAVSRAPTSRARARAIAVTTAKCRMRVVLEEPKEFISDSPKVSGKLAFLSKRLLMQS